MIGYKKGGSTSVMYSRAGTYYVFIFLLYNVENTHLLVIINHQ